MYVISVSVCTSIMRVSVIVSIIRVNVIIFIIRVNVIISIIRVNFIKTNNIVNLLSITKLNVDAPFVFYICHYYSFSPFLYFYCYRCVLIVSDLDIISINHHLITRKYTIDGSLLVLHRNVYNHYHCHHQTYHYCHWYYCDFYWYNHHCHYYHHFPIIINFIFTRIITNIIFLMFSRYL